MSNRELTERYVYAVTKGLPRKTRQDVSQELKSIIADMLEERCGPVAPTEHDLRVVLAELGTPAELAEKYSPTGDRALIGPPYYSKYLFVLKLVLIFTAFGLTLANILAFALGGETSWVLALAQWGGGLLSGLLTAFAIVTLLFAIFSWKGVNLNVQGDSLNDLPPVPKKKTEISRGETIFGIVFSVLFATLFLAAPEIFGVYRAADRQLVPIFNVDIVRMRWYLIAAFAVLGIGRECAKLLEGRYTLRLLAVIVAADAISGILSVVWLTDRLAINPGFASWIEALFTGEAEFITGIFANFQYFFLGIILFALALDMLTAVVKTLQNRTESY